MRKIKCELCGQRDLLKEGSRFVCQACGAAYSADQLRRQFDLAAQAEIYAEAKQAYRAKRFKQARQLYLALAEEGDQQGAFYASLSSSQLDPAADFAPLLNQLRAALAASREKGGGRLLCFCQPGPGRSDRFCPGSGRRM
jgi:DNA-directed RNA polymerase subunit RPC12/RpoP